MKDEIKEILEEVKDLTDITIEKGTYGISHKKWKLLLDYITNLQEEVNKLTAESTEWESKCYDLQKENESLYKELKLQKGTTRLFKNDLLNVMGNFMGTELDAFEQQEKELQDYKTRNEKAIEYIENNEDFETEIFDCNTGGCLGTDLSIQAKTLLNILQGKSDE